MAFYADDFFSLVLTPSPMEELETSKEESKKAGSYCLLEAKREQKVDLIHV